MSVGNSEAVTVSLQREQVLLREDVVRCKMNSFWLSCFSFFFFWSSQSYRHSRWGSFQAKQNWMAESRPVSGERGRALTCEFGGHARDQLPAAAEEGE